MHIKDRLKFTFWGRRGDWSYRVRKKAYSELTVDYARSSPALGLRNKATLDQTP